MKLTSRQTILAFVLLLSLTPAVARAGDQVRVSDVDRIRLSEAFSIGDKLGNQLWAGWNKAPFAVLLDTPEYEFLIRHPKPSSDFVLVNYDPLLKSNVYYRKRTQPIHLLATFPIGGIPTIVIGQAENTAKKTSTQWVVTMLHEHFHQLQYSRTGYYDDVNALGLTRGDQTGMWMLNYPFPYDWHEMQELFSHLSHSLANVLQAKSKSDFSAGLSTYLKQRREIENTLSPDDYRYVSFQMWQEGIARYTEYQIAKLAAGSYRPSKALRTLKDYQPFGEVAEDIRVGILSELTTVNLAESKRVIFYSLGAGEGLLLDRVNPRWRRRYLVDKFYLHKYFENSSSSSLETAAPVRLANEPVSAMLRAELMKAPHATQANAEPTEMRRTPKLVKWETVRSELKRDTRTFTGFGATAFTIASISLGLLTPGA